MLRRCEGETGQIPDMKGILLTLRSTAISERMAERRMTQMQLPRGEKTNAVRVPFIWSRGFAVFKIPFIRII
jgi:hypothetical protein